MLSGMTTLGELTSAQFPLPVALVIARIAGGTFDSVWSMAAWPERPADRLWENAGMGRLLRITGP